jgi:hypothetical protein
MFPHISGGKVYVHRCCEAQMPGHQHGTSISWSEELSPEDPSYEATKAWLIQLERGEWSLFPVPSDWSGAEISAKSLTESWRPEPRPEPG